MKRINIFTIVVAAVAIIAAVVLIGRYLVKNEPEMIQGTVECTSYKAS